MLLDKQLLQQTAAPEDIQSDSPIKSPGSPFSTPLQTNQNDPTRPTITSSLGAHLINQSNKQGTSISPFSGPSTSFANIPSNNRFPVYSPFLNNEELSAQAQSWYSKAGNAITKGAGIATSTFLQGTVGAVYGVGKWIEDGKFSSFYNNEFSQGLDQWNQSLENTLPNYYTQAERDANWYSPENLFSANFVFDKVIKNLGYAAGAYGAGASWAGAFKALSMLSKLSAAGGLVDMSVAAENAIGDVVNVGKLGKLEGLFSSIGNKFANNYNLLNPTQRVMYAGLMSTGEAGMEALQNTNQFRQKLINDYYEKNGALPSGLELERINKQSDEVGNLTFGLNTALLTLTNSLQLPKIIGSSYNLEKRQLVNGVKDINKIVLKEGEDTLNTLARTSTEQLYETAPKAATKFGRITQSIGNKIYRYGFSPSEAFEEGTQNVISVGTENYYNKKNKNGEASIIDDLFGFGVEKTLNTKEGIESILIGGLSGAISEFRGNLKESKERSSNTQSAISAFNETYLGSYLRSATDSINRNETLQQERVEAIRGNNILESKDLERDILVNYLTPRIQYGKYDLFIDDLEQYRQIASTPEGLQQLKQQGIISEEATQHDILSHLERLRQYGNTLKAQYEALNAKYSPLRKGKERIYTEEVINKMLYASAKVDDYSRRIPETSQTLLSSGILPQPIVEAIINKSEEQEELINSAIEQINQMPILQDGKDELRQNLSDVLEMSARRKQFLEEYKDIRDNPNKYKDKNDLTESFTQAPIKIGERELQIGRSYTPRNPIQIINGNLEINPRTQILGVNLLGEVSITTPNGTRSIPISKIESNDFIEQPLIRNQKNLEDRLNKTTEEFFNLPENNSIAANNPILNDPNSSLNEKISTINSLPNNADVLQRLQENLRKAVEDFAAEETAEQEKIDRLNEELAKVQNEISQEAALENPENLPIPEFEDKKKPIGIRFISSTTKAYKSATKGENNNYHKREAEFLNLLDSSSSPLEREKIKVVPVTVNNQESLGLSGLIPETYERKDAQGKEITVKNTDPNRGTVVLVYAYETPNGLRLIDKEGNLLNKLGETNDPNVFVYTHLATTDLTYHSEFNKGERNFSTPNKETTEQIKEYQKKGLTDRKFLLGVKSLEETPSYSFIVSLGIPNIITNEEGKPIQMNNSVVDSGIITQKDLSEKKLLSSRFPLSDTYLNLNGRYLKLNTHKFTEQEANNIYLLLKQMSKQVQESFSKTGKVEVDPIIKSYLSRVIYFDFPKGQKPKPKQVWISTRGTLHLGTDLRIEPTPTEIENNKQSIINFFKGSQMNVNPYQVNNDTPFAEITEVSEDSYKTARWKSYQHFLLSPIYDLSIKNKLQGTTRQALLTTNIITPQLLPDGTKEVPLMNKYITLQGEIATTKPEQESPNTKSQFDTFTNVDNISVKEKKDYSEILVNNYPPKNQLRFGQGQSAAVWIVGDEELLNYYTLANREQKQLKDPSAPKLTEDQLDQLTQLKEKYGTGVVSKLKTLAKENRTKEVEQIVVLGNKPEEEVILPDEQLPAEETQLPEENLDEITKEETPVVEEPKPILYLPLSDMTERMASVINENTGRPYTQPEVWGMRTENIIKVLKSNDLWYQIPGYETQLVSTEDTINKIKEFLKRIGTTIEYVESIKVNGVELGANGAASAVHNLVQIVEGKENIALPEEAMHIATELIYANKPELYTQLLNEAIKSDLYKEVVKSPEYRTAYKDDKGKINVSALQREAIAKILAEYVVKKNQSTTEKVDVIAEIQKIWSNIISFLKSLFNIANFNPFEAVATQILEGSETFSASPEIQQLFDSSKSTEQILTGVMEFVDNDFLKEQVNSLLPYLNSNPEIKFSKMFSIGRGEAHYTGDWTILLSNIKDKEQLAHTIVHELYHSISINELLNNPKFEENIQQYINKIREKLGLSDYFNGVTNTDFGANKDLRYYGLLNPKEFIAELFSNKEFSELIDQNEEKTFLDRIIDFIKGLTGGKIKSSSDQIRSSILNAIDTKIQFSNDELSKTLIKSYQEAARSSDFTYTQKSSLEDITFYQVSNNNKVLTDRIKEVKVVRELEDGKPVYLKPDATKVKNTIDQKIADYYKEKKANREISETQLKDSQKRREDNENAHLDINDIFNRYIDSETGLVRRNGEEEITPLNKTNISQIDPANNEYYDTLEEYLREVISSYPEGTQFLYDQVLYDESIDEAGKLDFIAIKPDGTHDDLNFKFLSIDTEKRADVPFHDKRAYNIEMSRLSRMLEKTYGLRKQGLSRTIPIVPKYERGSNQDLNLRSMKIGDTNVEHVNEKYLLPVPSQVETPKTKGVGKLLEQLNELIIRMEEDNTEKSTKFELQKQINNLTSAIRLLQVKDTINPLVKTVKNQVTNIQKQITNYETIFNSGNEEAIRGINAEEISKKLIDAYDALEVYKGLGVAFKDVYASGSVEYKELRNLSAKAANSQSDLVELSGLQTNSLANRYGIEGVLLAEKNVGYLAKKFFSLSDARTASTQLLSRIVNRVRQQREFEFDKELKNLKSLQDSLQKANLVEKAQDLIFAKENGKRTGLLTSKYQVEFYKQLNEALIIGNKQWLEENVELSAYNEEFKKSYEAFKEHLEATHSELEGDEKEQAINEPLEKFEKAYDVINHPSTAINELNERLQRFPKGDTWYTDQYKQITSSKPILELYEYMIEKNHEAYDIGLFKTYHGTFFANVKKGFAENLTFGLTEDGVSAIRNQVENIFNFQVEPEDSVYGYVDPITGQPKDKIFAYYTSQISADQKSYDIFKVLSLWNHELIKYKYLSEVENQVKLLHLVESNKNHLETDKFGNIKSEHIEDAIAHGNDNNSKYLKEFIEGTLYGKRFSTDQPDFGFSVGVEKLAKGINKVFGSEIVSMPDKQKIQVSAVKMVDAMNRWFRLKAMGLNPLSGLSALLGGTANATLNAGTYGTKNDYIAANLRLVGGKFGGVEGKKYAALMKYFMTHADGELSKKADKMSLNQFQRYLSSGDLMILLKKADEWVQNTNLLFFAQNFSLVGDNFVSIPQYVKEKNNYDQLFDTSKSTAERQQLKKKINEEIAQMKKTQSLIQQIKVEGEEISFEGIERNSESVFAFRDKVQQFTRDAIGNSTPENISLINRTIIGQSLMMFKSWIPSTVATRFGGLRYVVGKDSYDYGRARILGTVLRDQGLKSINTLLSYYVNGTASQGENNLVDLAKRVYQQKIEGFRKEGKFATDITGQLRINPETGENLTAFETKMTETEFIDMYLKGFDAAVKDVLATLSLAGILFSMRAYAPDKDDELDPQSKGYWRWAVRTVDKLQDELGFFYNPFSWQSVIGGQIFPSINVLSDIRTIIWNSIANSWLYMNGDEEAAEKMKVAKYVFKNIPGLNQGLYYAALFNSDLADELGIKITAQARQR